MDHQCPVCLHKINDPVETNCGHKFCGECLVGVWKIGSCNGPIRCPVCRQQVTIVLQCFRSRDASNSQLTHDINDYNRRFSGEPRPVSKFVSILNSLIASPSHIHLSLQWLDYIYDLPVLLRHMSSEFFSVGGLVYMFRIRVVLCFLAAIMYLISPLDFIPEAVFGLLGLFDDIFVILLLAIYITIIYRQFLASRWENDN